MRDERAGEAGATLATWLEERRKTAGQATPGPWEWDVVSGDLINPTIIDEELGDFGSVIGSYPRLIITGYCHDEITRQHIAANDPTTVTLILDVIAAAGRRRQAWATWSECTGTDACLEAGNAHDFAVEDEDAALAALDAHLRGNAGATP